MLDWVATKILALIALVPPLLSPDGEHFLLVRFGYRCSVDATISGCDAPASK